MWDLLPLTHITKALVAEDIITRDRVEPGAPDKLGGSFAYFFYGRPAYRATCDDVIKLEAACPYCFILDKELVRRAHDIFAFDTGAFNARLYKHVLIDEMSITDFSLERDVSRPNKLILAAFGDIVNYFDGNRSELVDPEVGAEPWEMEGRAYLYLLASPGRNEPDDRICSIEVVFADPVPVSSHLKAIVVPHTHWGNKSKAPWLQVLSRAGVEVVPYNFVPGRHPEHYQTLVELSVRDLFKRWKVF